MYILGTCMQSARFQCIAIRHAGDGIEMVRDRSGTLLQEFMRASTKPITGLCYSAYQPYIYAPRANGLV